ncbi:MFS transporter [Conexibacter sp. W3-3-2]|nr:MFS transporter [Conexibacter sp. W3-3-2]
MRSLLVLSMAAATFALAQSTLIPALTTLQEEFGTDAAGVAWVLTGYLVTAAVFTPIMGRLGDMFGKRRLLVISLVAFAAGSALSALGSTLEVVVAGRVLQGVAGGVFPLCFGIIRDEFPREKVPSSIGLIASIAGIGGGIGIVGGGLLVDQASYHWIFWVAAALAVVSAVGAQLLVPESPVRSPGKVDLRGAAILSVGLVLPLFAVSRATTWGWTDSRLVALVLAGLAVLAVWYRVEARTAQPLADVETLRSPPILMTNVATFLVGFGMFGSFILVPQLAQSPESSGYGFGLDATQAGLLLLPGSLSMLVTGPFAGALAGRVGPRVPLVIGGALSTLGLVLLGVAHGSELQVLLFGCVLFTGIGFAFAAMPNLIVAAVRPDQTGEATGFNALVRSAGASLGSQAAASILAGSALAGTVVPQESGFTTAFLVMGGVAAVATAVSCVIPEPGRSRAGVGLAEELAATAPLAERPATLSRA